MSVTDSHPTKVGQRVQEIYDDSRGWVVGLNFRTDEPTAVVDWDNKPVGDEDRVFPIEALRVVEVIRVDTDHYLDPSLSPLMRMVTNNDQGPDLTRYTWKDGDVSVGIERARQHLLAKNTHTGA